MLATSLSTVRLRMLLACLLTALIAASPLRAADKRPLVVATYAYPGSDRAGAIAVLTSYVGDAAKRDAELRVLPSPTALVAALHAGEVDVAVPNLHAYLLAMQKPELQVALAAPDVPAADAGRYRAVIVVPEDTALMDVDMLAGNARLVRLVMVAADSASGGFVPAAALREKGIADPAAKFAGFHYAGSHEAALAYLREGNADAAALAAEVVEKQGATGLREIWRSAPIPVPPLLCRAAEDVPCGRIAERLLQAHEREPEVMAGLRSGWPEFGAAARFVAVPKETFDDLTLPAAD